MCDLNVELVHSKSKIGDLNKRSINYYSECWDERYKERKTFKIIYDSKSSEIQIPWFLIDSGINVASSKLFFPTLSTTTSQSQFQHC
ncbi:hypothetical protein Hanom_Chr08g00686841 [Helianthus anomalus]